MDSFTLRLYSAMEQREFAGVTSFVGEDLSGSFGILAGHQRCMTSLVFGLARFRCGGDDWQYLALPGGLLYFLDNHLQIYSRSYLVASDYERISALLRQQLLAEEQSLHEMKESLRRMEESILRRLWEVGRRKAQE
ncbi:F-type H+-transporting ATPase subunit epsilon [Microbulbifer donghaiensis]|uniref:ATP synthase epsilon chain n=1 Tax=Microbulbifer donghaiensis TaxID=494016 RepID=A0A1M4ULX8_9GAMM|nr:F0F1 ATP synthase subunit epsilon [Microbulbifer donghaiensis]SHE57665.1 F-type H+-transporting ATPase subunit epsilon [Microbulbifer donghaiensis]